MHDNSSYRFPVILLSNKQTNKETHTKPPRLSLGWDHNHQQRQLKKYNCNNMMSTTDCKDTELVSGTRISLLSAELPIFPRLSLHSPNFAWATFNELSDGCNISNSYRLHHKKITDNDKFICINLNFVINDRIMKFLTVSISLVTNMTWIYRKGYKVPIRY